MIDYADGYLEDIGKAVLQIPNVASIYDKSVYVTGGTGLICSTIIDVLLYLNKYNNANIKIIVAARDKEKVIRRFNRFHINKDYLYEHYDAISMKEFQIEADYIIHGASNATPTAFDSEPVETIMANVNGLNALLEAGCKNKDSRLVYISSSEVYGIKETTNPYIEDNYGYVDILNPRSSYPCSKRLGETLCLAYIKEYGVNAVIARPGHIYGPEISSNDSRASAQFTRNAYQKEDIVMKSKGTQIRSYCNSLDCASAIMTVLLNGNKGEAYNISNSKSIVSIRQVAEMFAKVAGVNIGFENPTDKEKLSYNMMDNSSLDSNKLEDLGWSGIFDLEKGVKNTLDYYVQD